MKPAPFVYHAPLTLEEALDLLAEHGHDAKVLAGGQSLVPVLNMRLAAPAHLVDINRLPDLGQVEVTDELVRAGALVRHADLLADDVARRVLRTLVAEAGDDAELAAAVRDRVIGPWARALTRRLQGREHPVTRPVDPVFDQIMGPLYARALLTGPPPDHALVDAIVAAVAR